MRILLGMPIYHRVEPATMGSTIHLINHALTQRQVVIDFVYITDKMMDICRNLFATMVADSERWTHWLSVDADMGFTPERFERLLEKDVPLALAPGPRKQFPLSYALCTLGADQQTPDDDGWLKIRSAGLCFSLIKRELLLDLAVEYPHRADFVSPSGKRESIYQFFQKSYDSERGSYVEDDYEFCRKVIEVEGDVWADTYSDLIHVGRHDFQIPAEHWAKNQKRLGAGNES